MKIQEFIQTIAPIAVKLRLEGSPIFPSVRIAQAYHETGGVIHSWNNLVGYKVGNGRPTAYWNGQSVTSTTWEVINGVRVQTTARWRAYASIEDGFKDQDLLFNWERYKRVREATNPEEQANMLYECGYATDPQYAAKLIHYMRTYHLTDYDREAEKMLEQLKAEIEQLKQQVQMLQKRSELDHVPEWAKDAVQAAVNSGILLEPDQGSYDFYRMITILHRKGLI